MTCFPLGDAALVIEFAEKSSSEVRQRIRAYCEVLRASSVLGFLDVIPAYTTATVLYDPLQLDYPAAKAHALRLLEHSHTLSASSARLHEIPVCYAEQCAPDLQSVAAALKLTPQAVVDVHCSVEYEVAVVGFVPAFPYLVELPEQLRLPRRATPRLAVPAGSVGIAGAQTGIYPFETPGGWHLIGRTPLRLFRPTHQPPSLLQPGDRVKFYPISEQEFFRQSQYLTNEP
ncbi:MAG: 5-oxoprolinase subunit PxpB [Chloroherpetonaceae bacterium]|nr:5-oxoprolinase subunit PxpB [Chloroherpetonaceae bacterium]MCS7211504.1 5-oxoprolinase subunit PxpB [Chloroherpetonaceae bacterium]MDW8020131.1 5-oxoprolinase subunit PxpB [Chloroherpetonaceae bacterium]MDW8467476.1 5-oxoprolinase subunit PxpB [Chloroherpetonaceae bacterium]